MEPLFKDENEEDNAKCKCGALMDVYVPNINGNIPPHLLDKCGVCRTTLPSNNYAFKCNQAKSSADIQHDTLCIRCAKYQNQLSAANLRLHDYSRYNLSDIAVSDVSPIKNNDHKLSQDITCHFYRFLNAKNKKESNYYEQVHKLINLASDSAINSIFEQIASFDVNQKKHLLHSMYDHFDPHNAAKYNFIDDDDDAEKNDIGPSRLSQNYDKDSIMSKIKMHTIKEENKDNANLIAGNVNISYQNDNDFLLKNAHLFEQQLNEMERIKTLQQIEQDKDIKQALQSKEYQSIKALNSDDDSSSNCEIFDDEEKIIQIIEKNEPKNEKNEKLFLCNLEDLFGCTTGRNLTEKLGHDLWQYRIFIFLSKQSISCIMTTCRYFYSMQIIEDFLHNSIIRISSIPSFIWKMHIFKQFKMETKIKSQFVRIQFTKSMDWKTRISQKYLSQIDDDQMFTFPATICQIFVEYFCINSSILEMSFLRMLNSLFSKIFCNLSNSVKYAELMIKNTNKLTKDFSFQLDGFTLYGFTHIISSLKGINRLKIPCWTQEIFTPKVINYDFEHYDLWKNTTRNLQYIYLNDMKFENFAALSPNENGGLLAVEYFKQLQCVKGIVVLFGEDPTKRRAELWSMGEAVVTFLEILRKSVQYVMIGVKRMESIIRNPFIQSNHLDFYDDDGCVLPPSFLLYEFNYSFKREIQSIFWTNYENLISDENENKNDEIVHNAEEWVEEDGDAKEENAEEKSESKSLSELYNVLNDFKDSNKYLCAAKKPAFIVLFNTQMDVDGDEDVNGNKVPVNKDDVGRWQCPFCTVWNDRFCHRCSVCNKRKVKYIPMEILIQQQQFEQDRKNLNVYNGGYQDYEAVYESYSGWTCPICAGKNSENDQNCQLCTLERPK